MLVSIFFISLMAIQKNARILRYILRMLHEAYRSSMNYKWVRAVFFFYFFFVVVGCGHKSVAVYFICDWNQGHRTTQSLMKLSPRFVFLLFCRSKNILVVFRSIKLKKKTWDFEGCRGCEKFVLLSQQATAEKWKFGNRKKIFIILLCVRYASVCSCFVYTPETVAIHFQLAIFRRQIDTNNRIRHFFVIKICLLVWLNGEWFLFINREEMGIRYTAKKYVCVFCSTHLDV